MSSHPTLTRQSMTPPQVSRTPFRRKLDEGEEDLTKPTAGDCLSFRDRLTKLVPRDRNDETESSPRKSNSGNVSTNRESPSPKIQAESSVASKESQSLQEANIVYINLPVVDTTNPPERIPAYLLVPATYKFTPELLQRAHMTLRSAAGLLQATVHLSAKTDISVRGRECLSISYKPGELLFDAGKVFTKIRSTGFTGVVRLTLLVGPCVKLFLNGLLVYASDERFGKGRWEVAGVQWCKFWRLEHVHREKIFCFRPRDKIGDEKLKEDRGK